jgi:hypothetical protein
MAKIIGGGFPIGAFGGRRDIMEVFAVGGKGPRALHLGTFTANPISTQAGLATLRALDAAAFARLNGLGEAARSALRTTLAAREVTAQVTGAGSLFQSAQEPINDYHSAKTANADAAFLLFLGMMNHINSPPWDGLPVNANAAEARGPPGGSIRRDLHDLQREGWIQWPELGTRLTASSSWGRHEMEAKS